jgi:hypothetical protein
MVIDAQAIVSFTQVVAAVLPLLLPSENYYTLLAIR